jgi:predicted amidophosphoribosyltransferase
LAELGYHLCPHCDYEVEKDFLRCPNCMRKLKDPCPSCGRPLDPAWKVCPYCEAEVGSVPSTTQRRSRRRREAPVESTVAGARRESVAETTVAGASRRERESASEDTFVRAPSRERAASGPVASGFDAPAPVERGGQSAT